MKKLYQTLIALVSILAMIVAPIPRNVIAVASDIVETEIETETQVETTSDSLIDEADAVTEETIEDTTVSEDPSENSSEVTAIAESISDPKRTVESGEDPLNITNVYNNGYFGWIENGNSWGDSEIYVDLNDSITLNVPDYSVPDDTTVTIKWYKYPYVASAGYWDGNNAEIIGETNSYIVTDPITTKVRYQCLLIIDDGSQIYWDFTIYVDLDTHLKWTENNEKWIDTNVYVNPGESKTLDLPEFQIDAGIEYTIRWQCPKFSTVSYGVIVEAADSYTCDTPEITENVTYNAVIVDQYGNSIWANIYVKIDSGLEFYIAEGDYTSNGYGKDLYVTPGTSTTVYLPEIRINEGLDYTITWSWWNNSGSGSIDNASGSTSCTTNEITEYTEYHATVRDEYGNNIDASFYIHPESGLEFYIAEGDYTSNGYGKDLYVTPGTSTTVYLPEIRINEGLDYTISWNWWNNSGSGTIETAAGSTSCTTNEITEYTTYQARVSDEYGNNIYASFYIHIDTGLAWVDSEYRDDWYYKSVDVQPGYSATLAIPEIYINEGYEYHISWRCEGNSNIPYGIIEEAADSRTYTTPALTGDITYYVTVSDDYENRITAQFSINIDSGLYWTENSYPTVSVKYGEDYLLKVPSFNIADGLDASYTWMQEYNTIVGETSPRLELRDITKNTTYQCRVSDGYSTITAYFTVKVDTGLMWEDGTTRLNETLYYTPGSTLTIPMPAYGLSYEAVEHTRQWYSNPKTKNEDGNWYFSSFEAIECESDGSIVITSMDASTNYRFVVTDACGNTISAYYSVIVDTGFGWADGFSSTDRSISYSVAPGGSVNVEIPDIMLNSNYSPDDITYVWEMREPYEDHGYTYYHWVIRKDITGNTLQLNDIQTRTVGDVYIYDPYGNQLFVDFTVSVDSGLAWQDGSTYGSVYVEVPYGGTFDMWVPEFSINDEVDYTISIYGNFDGDYVRKSITKNDVVTSVPIIGTYYSYRIEIRDQYDNYIYFYIYCRTNYSLAWEDGSIYYLQNVNVDDLSAPITLQLPEYIYDGGEDLSITWTVRDADVSEDSKTITFEGPEEPTIVSARVTDLIGGSSIIAAFSIGLESKLEFADGKTQTLTRISLAEGEECTLTLPEIVSDGQELTYQWLRMSKDYAGGSKKGNLGNEDTYVVAHAAFSEYYYACLISDENGHCIRALYDILAPTHNYDIHGVCTLTGKYEAQAEYVSITLDGRIGLNFYVSVDQEVVDEGAYAVLSHGEDSEIVYLSDALKGSLASKSVYKLSYHVDAKEINDQVSLSIYDQYGSLIKMHNASGEEINSYSFSVAQYLERVDGNGIDEFKNLIAGMTAYGNLAGKYFGTVSGYEMSDEISAAIADCKIETVQEYAATESGAVPAGIKYYGSSLVLDSDTSIYHYFKLLDGASIDDYQFFVDGCEVEPVASGNMYRIEIKNIPAAKLSTSFETVVAPVGTTSGYTINYSAYSYVYSALASYDDNSHGDLINTVKSLYLYGNYAKDYFVPHQWLGGKA